MFVCVSLTHSAVGLSAVCERGISWSYFCLVPPNDLHIIHVLHFASLENKRKYTVMFHYRYLVLYTRPEKKRRYL